MNDIQAIDVHIHLVDEASIKARGGRTEQMARYMGYKLKVIPSTKWPINIVSGR